MHPLHAHPTQYLKKESTMSNTLTSVNDEISVQLDDNLRRALTHLRSTGLTDEQNIQQAILDTARNLFDATRLKDQLDAIDADPEDRAEMKELHSFMDSICEPW